MLSVTYLLLLETTHVKKQHYTSSNRRLWSAVKILVCFLRISLCHGGQINVFELCHESE